MNIIFDFLWWHLQFLWVRSFALHVCCNFILRTVFVFVSACAKKRKTIELSCTNNALTILHKQTFRYYQFQLNVWFSKTVYHFPVCNDILLVFGVHWMYRHAGMLHCIFLPFRQHRNRNWLALDCISAHINIFIEWQSLPSSSPKYAFER